MAMTSPLCTLSFPNASTILISTKYSLECTPLADIPIATDLELGLLYTSLEYLRDAFLKSVPDPWDYFDSQQVNVTNQEARTKQIMVEALRKDRVQSGDVIAIDKVSLSENLGIRLRMMTLKSNDGYVRLPTVMMKLLSDNGNQDFGDFKATILGMLGTYDYEKRILNTPTSLIEDDTYYMMKLLKKELLMGMARVRIIESVD
ncbi:hypothetical protein Tco_0728426 [Tanacetum coccineum]|uniref:Uncharacterized protein n=1 Tax=Tanacetum coccineum TaxID=301880 RepID=A0ABQ4YLY3_9ASTR